ncbi:MAG TPA: PaaI family thioesterase [Rhizomicrobium sp.]|nr:PaaI family thioesterase [Rhizomicrobium sp.]
MTNPHLSQLPPAAKLLGREVLRIDEDGTAHLRFFAPPEFANRHGTVQGGLVSAMLDSATMTPLLAQLAQDRIALTVKLETEFLRPAPLGELTARSWLLTRDERGATTRGELLGPGGTVVAAATATLRILPRRP